MKGRGHILPWGEGCWETATYVVKTATVDTPSLPPVALWVSEEITLLSLMRKAWKLSEPPGVELSQASDLISCLPPGPCLACSDFPSEL